MANSAKSENNQSATIETFLQPGAPVTVWLHGEASSTTAAHREQRSVVIGSNASGILLAGCSREGLGRVSKPMFWMWSSIAAIEVAEE